MLKSRVKEKIRKGQPTFGSWIMIGNIASAEILSQAGFDWITVDMEHTAIDYNTLQTLITAIKSNGPEGFNFIACSIDTLFLSNGSKAMMNGIREILPLE